MSTTADRLYELLPAIHRIRDAERGWPLQALLGVISEQVQLVEDDISQVDEQAAPQPRMQATLPGETKVQQFDPYTGKPIAPSTTEQQSTHV